MTQEQIVQLGFIILPFVLTVVVVPLAAHLISLLPVQKQKTATAKVALAVQATEQLAQRSTAALSSDTKKSLAKSAAQDLLKAAGITLDSSVLDTLIESAVYLLNQTQSSVNSTVLATTKATTLLPPSPASTLTPVPGTAPITPTGPPATPTSTK